MCKVGWMGGMGSGGFIWGMCWVGCCVLCRLLWSEEVIGDFWLSWYRRCGCCV